MTATTALLLAALLGGREMPPEAPPLVDAAEAAVASMGTISGHLAIETLAIMIITMDEESGFVIDPDWHGQHGDNGQSHCSMQVWAPKSTTDTPDKCMRAALVKMKESARLKPSNILANYCGGVGRPAAERISAHRLNRAKEALNSLITPQ